MRHNILDIEFDNGFKNDASNKGNKKYLDIFCFFIMKTFCISKEVFK